MKPFQNFLTLSLLWGLTYFTLSNALVRRFNYDGLLYEEMSVDSRYIQYSRSVKDHWKNLTSMADLHNFPHHAMFCTRGGGSWLAYPKEDYMLGESVFYTLIISEACIPTDNIKSLQPIGEIQTPLDEGLVIFPKENFQGQQKLLNSGSSSAEAGSLIYVGGLPFTITSGSESICLMPAYWMLGNGLCLLPVIDSSFNMADKSKSIKEGCKDEKSRLVSAQNCYSTGVHRIFSSTDFSSQNMNSICGSGANDVLKNKFGHVMEIWKGRVSHGIEEMENIKMPYEASFKQKTLWEMVNVFLNSCPTVPTSYIAILRNVFLMHLRQVWTDKPELIGMEDDYWKHAFIFLTACGNNVHDEITLRNEDANCMPNDVGDDHENLDADAFQELLGDEPFDAVIEQMWLILNHVIPYCNWVNEFKTNDWTNIVSLFRRHYFDVLQEQWENPGPWQTAYTAMFHGFNMQQQRLRILGCIQSALAKTPHFDPIGRTRYFLRKEHEIIVAMENSTNIVKSPSGGGDKPKDSDGSETNKPNDSGKTPNKGRKVESSKKGKTASKGKSNKGRSSKGKAKS